MTNLTLRKTSPCSDTFTDACARRSSAMSRIPLPSYRTDLSAKYPANSADKNRRITRNGHMMALTRLYTRILESSCKKIQIEEEERKEREKIPTQAVQKMRFQAPRRTKQKSARKKEKLLLRWKASTAGFWTHNTCTQNRCKGLVYMTYIQSRRTSEEYLTRRDATPRGRAGARARLRPEKQRDNTRRRQRGGAMITATDETHIFK